MNQNAFGGHLPSQLEPVMAFPKFGCSGEGKAHGLRKWSRCIRYPFLNSRIQTAILSYIFCGLEMWCSVEKAHRSLLSGAAQGRACTQLGSLARAVYLCQSGTFNFGVPTPNSLPRVAHGIHNGVIRLSIFGRKPARMRCAGGCRIALLDMDRCIREGSRVCRCRRMGIC